METNTPLYMFRRGGEYTLTYDDSDLPSHYGWKTASRIDELRARFEALSSELAAQKPQPPTEAEVWAIIDSLDNQSRWLLTYDGESLVGQGRFEIGEKYLSSELFSENITLLSRYVSIAK